MSSALYAVGYLFLIAVVSYLAHLSHIPDSYIFAIDVIMLGIGVVTGWRVRGRRIRTTEESVPPAAFTLGRWIPLRSSFWILDRSIRS